MKTDKIKSYIGFAIKSNSILFGWDKIKESKKLPNLVLVCSTQNDKVTEKVHRFCKNTNIKFIKLNRDITLSELVSRDNCKVIGIINNNLSVAIIKEFENGI